VGKWNKKEINTVISNGNYCSKKIPLTKDYPLLRHDSRDDSINILGVCSILFG